MEEKEEMKEFEQEGESKFKKIFIFVAGIISLILILSYVFVGPLGDIIRGQLESTPLEGNQIDLEDFSIIFENDVHKELQEIYFDEQKVEFSVCLQGEKLKDIYQITSLYQPKMFEQTFNHVSFESCSEDSLIILHSHPYKSCLASQTDLNTLKSTQKRNADILMVVMCEPARFSVYS